MVTMVNATNPSSALYFVSLNVVGSFVARPRSASETPRLRPEPASPEAHFSVQS